MASLDDKLRNFDGAPNDVGASKIFGDVEATSQEEEIDLERIEKVYK